MDGDLESADDWRAGQGEARSGGVRIRKWQVRESADQERAVGGRAKTQGDRPNCVHTRKVLGHATRVGQPD